MASPRHSSSTLGSALGLHINCDFFAARRMVICVFGFVFIKLKN